MKEKDIKELKKRGYDLEELGADKSKESRKQIERVSMSLDDMRIAIRKNTNWRIFQQILFVISTVISIISLIIALKIL